MIPRVEVYLEETQEPVLVGQAHFALRRGEVSTTFVYDTGYVASPISYAIDPNLPLRSAPIHVMGLPGAFRDSAPDRWGRRIVMRKMREQSIETGEPLRSLDEVDYLLGASSSTRQGALSYRAPGEKDFLSPSSDVPPLVQLPRLLAASRMVERDEAGHEEVKALLDAGSASLGGARPKASVADGGRLYIAKFSHASDEWDVMAWEKIMLDLAQKAGIAVPARRLIVIGDQTVLLVERFDRTAGALCGGRVPYLSAMSLLGARDGATCDYAEVAEAMEPFVGDVSGQIRELLRRIVFSIAVHNTDDHLRNLGFLRIARRWGLSSAFDINPEPSLDRGRATTVFGESGTNEAQGAFEFAGAFGVTLEQSRKLVAEVLKAVGTWKAAARANGCKEHEMRLFEPVFSDRCAAVASAFGL